MKKTKKIDSEWPEVWNQVRAVMERNHAPDAVREAAHPANVGWNYGNGKFYIFCPKAVYEWIEKPPAPDIDSNLKFIKPIIWPFMVKYNCKDLIYKIIKPSES